MRMNIFPFRWKKTVISDGPDKSLYWKLFSFLNSQITTPRNAQQLIELGEKAPNQNINEIFQTYLLYEKYLTSIEPEQRYERHSLRETILKQFPELNSEAIFSILFLNHIEQKNTLAIQFLRSFLDNLIGKFGHAADGYLEKKVAELLSLENRKSVAESFPELQFFSFDIFQFVSNNYGNGLAGKVFERTYETFSSKYKDLEFFPHLITLIPKEIVSREHLGIFNQAQIEQAFLEKLAESERLNVALHQKIQELEITRRKAEEAVMAKSQFLSVMSHEIRTPLNAVIGFTQLLLQNNPRSDQDSDLRSLQFSGESLLNIINDILDFNKLDSGKVELSSVEFNLRELMQSLYQSFSFRAKEKQIVFDVEYDDRMPFVVKGDSLRISQVLNNLISNAIKFTLEGSVKLRLSLMDQTEKTLTVSFAVTDTGIGIAPESQDKIFEQFTQANSDTTRLFGGTGLGLSISSKLVELMGSKLKIESETGKGSTFYFSVILLKSSGAQIMEMPKKGSQSKHSFRNKSILLAEDNGFNANIARRFIEGWGGELDVALDGQQALEFALRKKYDLILMDVQMPVLDGFACTKEIRKHFTDIPIIAVTASPINDVMDEINACGMNDFVSKPFKPNELHLKMQQFLEGKS
jgi:signal transduction histidine kinase/ActR/RegA family two-component response regulator